MDENYDYDENFEGETIAVGQRVYDDAQLQRQQRAMLDTSEQAAKAAYVPEAVKDFILYFQKCLRDKNVHELNNCYENSFRRLTDKFYKSQPWPRPDVVSHIVNEDDTFMLFYKEVYYRHLHARTQQPDVEQRLEAYHNYCTLFGYIINPPNDEAADLELPLNWTWDIIDEFIYQFNAFHIYRNRAVKTNATADLEILDKNPGAWSAYSVLNVLYSLAGKANMPEQLKAMNAGQDPSGVAGKYGQKSLYKLLGYFSIIGLLRVHCLLGDFSLALKTMDGIQLNKNAQFARVASAYFTTYYYVGFSYLMLHRYADAIKAFSHILLYISRTKNINLSVQFDQVTKKSEQMYALLAMCVTLSPTRLDEVIHVGLRDKYGDQLQRMQRGGPEALKIFEELFLFAAPKFISPSPAEQLEPQTVADPIQHHLQVFLATVQNATLGTSLKSYLNLYATMDISKLSGFLDTTVDDLRSALVCFKLKNRQICWTEGRLLNGESGNTSDIDIILEGDLIHIAETKGGRKFADWFIRNTVKNYSVQGFIANPERELERSRGYKRDKKESK